MVVGFAVSSICFGMDIVEMEVQTCIMEGNADLRVSKGD